MLLFFCTKYEKYACLSRVIASQPEHNIFVWAPRVTRFIEKKEQNYLHHNILSTLVVRWDEYVRVHTIAWTHLCKYKSKQNNEELRKRFRASFKATVFVTEYKVYLVINSNLVHAVLSEQTIQFSDETSNLMKWLRSLLLHFQFVCKILC
jgi:hypothetical protein